MGTKKCKHCQSDIDKKAKVCPVCKKKQGGILKFIIIGIVVIGIIGALTSEGEDEPKIANTSSTNNSSAKDTPETTPEATPEPTEVPIEYIKYDVSELMDDLDTNALKAEKKYNDQYVEITGKLYNIDSSGKYISLGPSEDDFTFIGVQCYLKNSDHSDKVLEMEKGQVITLKGKIKSVGEVLGYSLNIEEIE